MKNEQIYLVNGENMEYKAEKNKFFNNLIWLNKKEASEYLRVTPNNLRSMVCKGTIKHYKFNNRLRFNKEELDNLIKSSTEKRR